MPRACRIELANYAVKMEVRTLYREEPLEDVMGFFRDRDLGILKGPDGTWLTHDDLIARLEPVVCDMAQLQDLLATMRGTLQGDPPDFLVAKPSPCAVLSGVVDEPSLKKNACLYRQVGVKERSPTGPGIPFARAMLLFMSLFLLPSTVYGLTLADGMPYILYQAVVRQCAVVRCGVLWCAVVCCRSCCRPCCFMQMVNVPVGKNPVMMMPLVNLLYMWGPYHTLMMLSILLLNLGLPKDVRKNELLFTTDDPHFQPTYFQPKRSFFKGKQGTCP